MRFPLGELHKPEVRELARARRTGGGRQARLAGPVLPRRHRPGRVPRSATAASASAPGAIVDARGRDARRARRRARVHRRAAPRPRHRRRASRCTCSRTDAAANTVTVGPRRELLARELAVREADAAPRRRLRRRRARARARAHAPAAALARRARRRAPRARRASSCERAAERTAPGQIACLYAGDVGRRPRARSPPLTPLPRGAARLRSSRDDDLGRDPRALPELLRGARPPAHPLGLAGALRARSLGAADGRRDAPAEALLPRPGDAAGAAPDELPEGAFARSTSTTSATPPAI